jgi:hypothetical protein
MSLATHAAKSKDSRAGFPSASMSSILYRLVGRDVEDASTCLPFACFVHFNPF